VEEENHVMEQLGLLWITPFLELCFEKLAVATKDQTNMCACGNISCPAATLQAQLQLPGALIATCAGNS